MHADQRRNALIRFALNFLKANLEDIQDDDEGGLLCDFDPMPTEEEIEKLKESLGVN